MQKGLQALDTFKSACIAFVNGINNTLDEHLLSSLQISRYAGFKDIHCLYRASSGAALDVAESACALLYHRSSVISEEIKRSMADYFAEHPQGMYLQICHSNGAIQVYNALKDLQSNREMIKRVVVVAIAPAKIIPSAMCGRAVNYVSVSHGIPRDIVPFFDVVGLIKNRQDVRFVQAHPKADLWDHSFLSPTYGAVMEQEIQNFIESMTIK